MLTGLGERIVGTFFVLVVNEEDKCRMVCDIFFLSATKILVERKIDTYSDNFPLYVKS